ncbi:zinc finger protein 2 homolog [Harmonia axyridis]|uniref:zinc finger protein 2 homolog n=1 Tax=Harmonia axyridis TaxID=115357 RepID=UPI001E27880D|nr:zinc finger protein 2 homolog [Harmonia axyridis]
MDETSLKCPLCCEESFDSLRSLKMHISDVLNKLECPICKGNFNAFENFAQHLLECEVCESENTESINDSNSDGNSKNLDENNFSEEKNENENVKNYCEICDVRFEEVKKHLSEYHVGEQVAIESQNLDELLGESEEISGDELPREFLSEPPPLVPIERDRVFVSKEILNENGKFNTKNLTKIDIIPEPKKVFPLMEKIVYQQICGNEIILRFYPCKDCNRRFPQLNAYKKHDCKSKKYEVCDMCSVHFSRKSGLAQHKRKYHKEEIKSKDSEKHHCEVCNSNFLTEKSLMLHKKMHEPKKIKRLIQPQFNKMEEIHEMFTCEVCGKEYDKKYEEVHLKSHSEEAANCTICNRKFVDLEDLSLHLQAHGNEVEKKISCGFCKKPFTNKESLGDHVENDCKERKYACSFCGKKFSKAFEKVKHERIHTGHKPYICDICGKAFRVSYCLTLHMRTHSGVRPYQCHICDKRFKSHSVYNHHLQIHSDIRPYHCPFCPKAFKTAVQLAGHKNSHTKPFSCKICNRPFASLYAVRLHMKSHDGKNDLQHQCHICGAEYVRYIALQDHVATHSEAEKEEAKILEKERKIQEEEENENMS